MSQEKVDAQKNVDLIRAISDASNRRDKAAFMALCDPDLEWLPPAEWPEHTPVHGREAVWSFIDQINEPWGEGAYEVRQVIAGGRDTAVGHVTRHVLGRSSGVDAEFDYWCAVTFRDGKALRVAWFRDRDEALEAAGLPVPAPQGGENPVPRA